MSFIVSMYVMLNRPSSGSTPDHMMPRRMTLKPQSERFARYSGLSISGGTHGTFFSTEFEPWKSSRRPSASTKKPSASTLIGPLNAGGVLGLWGDEERRGTAGAGGGRGLARPACKTTGRVSLWPLRASISERSGLEFEENGDPAIWLDLGRKRKRSDESTASAEWAWRRLWINLLNDCNYENL